MQFVDKHDNTIPSSDNWRTKVSPIPSFLQDAGKDDLFPTDEKDKESPLMKGILYTILTATIGVLVGYVVSYLMRAPQASTTQALEELVSSVKTQSDTILAASKTASTQANGKGTATAAPAASSATSPQASPTAKSTPVVAPSAPPLPPAANVAPTAAVSAAEKPKDAAPATTTAATPPTPAAPPAAAKKPIPQGLVFLKGTNPYGPPPLVEQDIFNPSTLLKVEYDPSESKPTPVYTPHDVATPTFQQLLEEPAAVAPIIKETVPQQESFQVQLGAFSSRLNATQFANRLQEKGYEVNIYEGWSKNRMAWYFVRLGKDFDHITALETAKNIQTTEKFLPMVVQPIETEKKLR